MSELENAIYETTILERVPDGARLLGEGDLNWMSSERTTDRYGAVYLCHGDTPVYLDESIAGQHGALVCQVVATRQSNHIGDLFRCIFPRTPQIGQVIELGRPGRASFARDQDYLTISIEPDSGRENDWFNPRALYDVHSQTVRLYFVPIKEVYRD